MHLRQFYRFVAAALSAVIVGTMAPALYLQETLPDRFTIAAGEELQLAPQYISCHHSSKTDSISVSNSISGVLP